METTLNPALSATYRVLGKNEECRIEIGRNGTVLIRIGKQSTVIPIEAAIALQSEQARDYLSDPTIMAFLYAGRDSLDRKHAAWDITRAQVVDQRRDFKRELMAAGIAEPDATWLAVLKHP